MPAGIGIERQANTFAQPKSRAENFLAFLVADEPWRRAFLAAYEMRQFNALFSQVIGNLRVPSSMTFL